MTPCVHVAGFADCHKVTGTRLDSHYLFVCGSFGDILFAVFGGAEYHHAAIVHYEAVAVIGSGNIQNLAILHIGTQILNLAVLIGVSGLLIEGEGLAAGNGAVLLEQYRIIVGEGNLLHFGIVLLLIGKLNKAEHAVVVAPHIHTPVVHYKGRYLIAADELTYMVGIDGAVNKLLRLLGIWVVRVLEIAVLSVTVGAPADHLTIGSDGYDMVRTGGSGNHLAGLYGIGIVGIVHARKVVLNVAPKIEGIILAYANGEIGKAVYILYLVLQAFRHRFHVVNRGHVGLERIGVIKIHGHEVRPNEHKQEHAYQHNQCNHGQLPAKESLRCHYGRAFNLFDGELFVITHFFAATTEGPPEPVAQGAEHAVLFGSAVVFLFHRLPPLLVDADTRIDQTVYKVDNQVAEEGNGNVEHL